MSAGSVFVTEHAARRAAQRCGVDWLQLIAQVAQAGDDAFIHKDNEVWISVVGPAGRGTAIVDTTSREWRVVTVRDASGATQGEDRSPLTTSLLDAQGEAFVKLLEDWQGV